MSVAALRRPETPRTPRTVLAAAWGPLAAAVIIARVVYIFVLWPLLRWP